jgi:hypothetical protein
MSLHNSMAPHGLDAEAFAELGRAGHRGRHRLPDLKLPNTSPAAPLGPPAREARSRLSHINAAH